MSLSAEDIINLETFLKHSDIKCHVKVKKEFRNYMESQINPDALVIDVDDVATLKIILKKISAMNKNKTENDYLTARVAAGGRDKNGGYSASFSATEITRGDINIRLTGKEFTTVERLDDSTIVRVGGSVQMFELQEQLERRFGLVLPSTSLIPYVTVAGLSGTGGHGTGRDQTSFAGLIRGATIITANGEEKRLEVNDPDFHILMSAHAGTLGVIKDLDIECMPAKKLQMIQEKRSIPEFFDEVRNGLFLKNEYVSVMIVPEYRKEKDELTNRHLKNVNIITHKPVPLTTYDVNHHPGLNHFIQETEVRAEQLLNVPQYLREHPDVTPALMQNLTGPASIGKKDEFSEGDWATQWHFRTAFPHPSHHSASPKDSVLDEICPFIKVKDTAPGEAHGEEIINFITDIYKKLYQGKRSEFPVDYAIFLRFLQGDNDELACTAVPKGYHCCPIDITTIGNAKGFDEFKQYIADLTLNKYEGKFHPGKNWTMDMDYRRLIGEEKLLRYRAALERWNQKNHVDSTRNPFMNDLMRQVLLYPARQLQNEVVMQAVPNQLAALKHAGFHKPVTEQQKKQPVFDRDSCCNIL